MSLPNPMIDMDPSDGILAGDFFAFADLLSARERDTLARLREFLRTEVAPVALRAWADAEFPHQLIPGFAALDIAGLAYEGYPGPRASRRLIGFIALEISRVDPSINSFFGVHTGLAMGSIHACGTREQLDRWLPAMARMELIGAFALTEPHGGSDVAGGMETTARRDGDSWILEGEKRWIGNGTFADLVVVWARDASDDAVRGFVVERGTPGFSATKIEGKTALRTVQNADITLSAVRVPEANRLSGGGGTFKDAGGVLRRTRANAAWGATGCQMAAYELALSYAKQRVQFGKPIAGFQMVQDLLVSMLGNVTASLAMANRIADLLDTGAGTGQASDAHSSLTKEFCASRMRETVAWARQVIGGNGVLLDNGVAKFMADAEALYSFEGTREINTLIVGKAITGSSAFV